MFFTPAHTHARAHTHMHMHTHPHADLTEMVLGLDLPDLVLADLLDEMSTIEHRLGAGSSDKLQLGALVGVFMIARQAMTSEEIN